MVWYSYVQTYALLSAPASLAIPITNTNAASKATILLLCILLPSHSFLLLLKTIFNNCLKKYYFLHFLHMPNISSLCLIGVKPCSEASLSCNLSIAGFTTSLASPHFIH